MRMSIGTRLPRDVRFKSFMTLPSGSLWEEGKCYDRNLNFFDNVAGMAGFQRWKEQQCCLLIFESKICLSCEFLSHQYFIAVFFFFWECKSKYIELSFTQTKVLDKQNQHP